MMDSSLAESKQALSGGHSLGPAKTYILGGTPRTYAIETGDVTDNWTIKKGPHKGNRGPVRGN